MTKDEATAFMIRKLEQWKDGDVVASAQEWLQKSYGRITNLFADKSLRDFVLEPFNGVLDNSSKSLEPSVCAIVTQVAVVNAVLAGLPGKMGIGVFVSMALEAWMAFRIARHVGVEMESPKDVFKYLGLLAGTVLAIGWGFSALLNAVFSVVSLLPVAVPATVITQLVVTDIFGILALVAFTEVKEGRSFKVPIRLWKGFVLQSKELISHHFNFLKHMINPETIKQTGLRAWTYLKGDIPIDARGVNGEVFATLAMLYLLSDRHEEPQGPLGENFLEAIRLRWSSQLGPEASIQDIAEHFRQYDPDSLAGAANTIKGKMFELMVAESNEIYRDNWSASLHIDESFPGSDIVFTADDRAQRVEVSLKAVGAENSHLVESALQRYPDVPIMTTDEVAAIFEDNGMVSPSGIKHEDLATMTDEMIDQLIQEISPISTTEVVVGGVTLGTVAALWPFVMAFLRRNISQEQLTKVFERALGDAGVTLASRVSYALVLGPVFAWYLLARGVLSVMSAAEPQEVQTIYVSYARRD